MDFLPAPVEALRRALAVLALLAPFAAVAQPPVNDQFARRIMLTGPTNRVVGSNLGASKEAGEPDHAGNPGGSSVWWTWTATTDGFLTLSTAGSVAEGGWNLDTLLAVYTGSSVAALTPVAANDDEDFALGVFSSRVTLPVRAGVAYHIAVDGYSDELLPADEGAIQLSVIFTIEPFVPLAPAWTLRNADGAEVRSTDFAGKVVILNLWATWCEPCLAEIPDLITLQREYGPDGFVVVGVSIDNAASGGAMPVALLRSFINQLGINYPIVWAGPTHQLLQDIGDVESFPTTLVIDRNNAIVRRVTGARDHDTFEALIKPPLYANLRLDLRIEGDELNFSWPVTRAGFQLQTTPALRPTDWRPVIAPVVEAGGRRTVTIWRESDVGFFRLRML